MDKKYIRCAVYIFIIFVSIVVIGNLAVFVYSDKKENSMFFENVENSGIKQSASKTTLVGMILRDSFNDMVNLKYESTYNLLSNDAKEKFQTIEKFGEFMSTNYVNVLSSVNVEYAGYDAGRNVYMYDVYLMGPPDMTALDEKDKELYKEKLLYVDAHIDENNDFVIDFDI